MKTLEDLWAVLWTAAAPGESQGVVKQAQILRKVDDDRWLVRLYDWTSGEPAEMEACLHSDLVNPARCSLFETREELTTRLPRGANSTRTRGR